MEIFVSGNVPSSKNSKRWTGKMLINSKTVMKYYKAVEEQMLLNAKAFRNEFDNRNKPCRISFKFIRGSRRKFDYINPAQTIQDLMVKYNWIKDDNCTQVLPIFEEYEYDKESPGVLIKII